MRVVTLLLALLMALAAFTPAYAQDAAQPPEDGAAEPAAQETGAPAAAQQEVPLIVLERNLRFTLRPTLLGLVPPDDPRGYGEAFYRITSASPERLTLHFEIKELAEASEDGGVVYGWWEQPEGDTGPMTRIRRGEVEATGLGSAREMLSPLLWGEGGFTTDSSLLWLSRVCYRELASVVGKTAWEGHCAPEAPDGLREHWQELVSQRLAVAGVEQLELVYQGQAQYPCVVNGARLRLPAIRARDSAGIAEYWIYDDVDNPLVLKLSYLPGPATNGGGDESEAAGAGPVENLLSEGVGYAIVEIDF